MSGGLLRYVTPANAGRKADLPRSANNLLHASLLYHVRNAGVPLVRADGTVETFNPLRAATSHEQVRLETEVKLGLDWLVRPRSNDLMMELGEDRVYLECKTCAFSGRDTEIHTRSPFLFNAAASILRNNPDLRPEKTEDLLSDEVRDAPSLMCVVWDSRPGEGVVLAGLCFTDVAILRLMAGTGRRTAQGAVALERALRDYRDTGKFAFPEAGKFDQKCATVKPFRGVPGVAGSALDPRVLRFDVRAEELVTGHVCADRNLWVAVETGRLEARVRALEEENRRLREESARADPEFNLGVIERAMDELKLSA